MSFLCRTFYGVKLDSSLYTKNCVIIIALERVKIKNHKPFNISLPNKIKY